MTAEELTLMRRREVGVVFQFFNLLPYLDARENVELPLLLDAVDTDERRNRATKALEMVGLLHRATHRPPQMSGGEMQRVAIARALVISPRLVLADEPTGNLDSAAGRQIISLLRDINDSTGVTMLVVTHDPVWAANCDRVVRLVDGLVSEDTYLKPRDNDDGETTGRRAGAETSGKNRGKAATALQ
jgi:putative ABC transport system ATP-binding protein